MAKRKVRVLNELLAPFDVASVVALSSSLKFIAGVAIEVGHPNRAELAAIAQLQETATVLDTFSQTLEKYQ